MESPTPESESVEMLQRVSPQSLPEVLSDWPYSQTYAGFPFSLKQASPNHGILRRYLQHVV
jgi:hypothetical protein